ncbi:MAG: hypothetical protein LBM25_03950 [Bacteroidales bacterium]|jgi:hypothetical protein|nr:hypothetical protein [Bacteroidales bacterium]
MQSIKIYIVTLLFVAGLLTNSSISYEERVSLALKFDSGLSIKKDISSGLFTKFITSQKDKLKNNLDFIISEERMIFSNLKKDNSYDEFLFCDIKKGESSHFDFCYNKDKCNNKYLLSIYQLNTIRI